MGVFKYLILFTFFISLVHADTIAMIAKEYGLYAGTKASIQWERIFSSERRMKKMNLDRLDAKQQQQLKEYLIKHAADSEQPMVPGL